MMLFYFTLFTIFTISYCYEYCSFEKNLCENKKHISCIKPQLKPYRTVIICEITKKLRDVFLNKHNYIRNETACGELNAKYEKFPSATKMIEVKWDYELEYLAELHVRACSTSKDQCRNTKRFPFVAQITSAVNSNDPDTVHVIQSILDDWISKSKNVRNPGKIIQRFKKNSTHSDLMVMINERLQFIGCSFAKCIFSNGTKQIVTCNYSNDLRDDNVVYHQGETQKDCLKKIYFDKDLKKSCLCKNLG